MTRSGLGTWVMLENKARNCGQCEKCMRTVLSFRLIPMDLPACFAQDVTDEQVASLTGVTPGTQAWAALWDSAVTARRNDAGNWGVTCHPV